MHTVLDTVQVSANSTVCCCAGYMFELLHQGVAEVTHGAVAPTGGGVIKMDADSHWSVTQPLLLAATILRRALTGTLHDHGNETEGERKTCNGKQTYVLSVLAYKIHVLVSHTTETTN